MTQSGEALALDNATRHGPVPSPATEVLVLAVGDYLYRDADARDCVYRVEKGVVAVFERRIGGTTTIIEMAGPGDYVGLGCLERHRDNARAAVACVVSSIPNREFARLAEENPWLRRKQSNAIKLDFQHGRALAHDRGRAAPVERVAAFLLAVSRQNANEGRESSIVSDSLKCGFVANLLDMDVGTLADALLELQARGLVDLGVGSDLHLGDLEALEHLADGDNSDAKPDRASLPMTTPSPREAIGPLLQRQPAGSPAPAAEGSWVSEVREVTWLLSAVGGLSVVGVALAVMLAVALAM